MAAVVAWEAGSETHITTAAYYRLSNRKSNGFVFQIANTVDNGNGTTNIVLARAATLPIITKEQNSDHAVKLARLCRNVVIEEESEEDNKGGHMQDLHTSVIVQTLHWVEFRNMGRAGDVDKFVSDATAFCEAVPVYDQQ